MVLILLLYALFASAFVIVKYGLMYTSPFFLVGSRMFIAGVLMLAYQGMKDSSRLHLKKENLVWIVLLGVLNIYLANAFECLGLQHLTSFKMCFFYNFSPFIAAIFGYFILSEKLSWKKWLGLGIGSLGFISFLFKLEDSESFACDIWVFSWGELAAFLAVTCSVFGWIFLRKLTVFSGISFFVVNGYSMAIGGVFALIHSLCIEKWNPLPTTDAYMFLKVCFSLVLISNFIGYNLYGYLLKRFSVTFMVFSGFITSIFTALFGYLFLQETVLVESFFAIGFVLLGLVIFYYEELRLRRRGFMPVTVE